MGDSVEDNERLDEQAVASIRAGLARILASDVFSAAPQLSAFLSFVVERAVEGRRAELKGYTIAVEALGRPADFDPQADPIVRVEAGRLRRALTQYYAGEGQDDPVRMTMPVGGYAPVFAFVEPGDRVGPEPFVPPGGPVDGQDMRADIAERDAAARRWLLVALAVLACALLALLVWYLEPFGETPQSNLVTQTSRPADTSPPEVARDRSTAPSAQLVSVAIVIPRVPTDPKLAEAVRRVAEVLVDVTARFDDLLVIKAPAPGAPPPEGVDYVFEISILSTEGALEGFGRLRAAKDGRIVWTASSSRPVGELLQDQDLVDLARRVGTRLAEPFGVIHADFRQNSSAPAMQCIFQAFDYRRFMTPEKRVAARTCLEQLVERDPGFYPAWAQFALLMAGEYAAAPDAGRSASLDRAMAATLTAIRLAPSGARAQQAMMEILFLRGSVADAIRAGREAVNRNPYDPDIMATLGSLYVRLNRPAEGLPLLERAIEISAGRPPWYDFYAFLAAYLTGARRLSETYSAVLEADGTPFSLLGQALQASMSGDSTRRDFALSELARRSPLFGSDPRLYLARRGFSEDVTQRIVGDLGIAGR
ncbi:hypothetical protein IED13_13255 [Bosea sp. SSUT16]|uniref:Adenylate cyclase n=1 Tax=Bosea spartocytisi TaxID=2773451 RepID=A0A927I0M3_9HYPH|nr:hypothetical protein [Bosea spartocytisi]MBD3846671.1 hypothetical protein [Bosea spartocytisi]MCT4473694.1 hypothetical protein [Bosea spartocytisi]